MRTNRYQSYFEEELREANPVKLIVILYRGPLDAIASARRFVRIAKFDRGRGPLQSDRNLG